MNCRSGFGILWCLIAFYSGILVIEAVPLLEDNAVIKPQKLIVQEGAYFQLPCAPEGSEEILHFFTWNKNKEIVVDKMTNASSRFEIQNDFSLLVEDVEEKDRGIYSCNIQSKPPRLTLYEVEVEVHASVEMVPESGLLTLNRHEDAELVCRVKGNPLPVVSWYFEGKPMRLQDIVEEKTSNTSLLSRIVLPDVSRHDSGQYTCVADNSISKDIGNFTITVISPPEILVDQTWVHAGLGTRAELACRVYGEPKPEVAWFFEGKPIEASNRAAMVFHGDRHSLLLKNIRDADLGNYSCRARSDLGEAEKTLVISGLPGRAVVRAELPREGTKKDDVSGGQSFTLLWTVASHSQLYEYKFSLRPYGGESQEAKEWIIPAEQSGSSTFLHSQAYVLRGLEPGKAYQVTLQSRNRFGWSQHSDTLILYAGNDEEDFSWTSNPSVTNSTKSIAETSSTSITSISPESTTLSVVLSETTTTSVLTTPVATTTEFNSHVAHDEHLLTSNDPEDENELESEFPDKEKESEPIKETKDKDMEAILAQEELIEEEKQEALDNAGLDSPDYLLPPIIDPILIDITTETLMAADTTTTAATTTLTASTTTEEAISSTVPVPVIELSILEKKVVVNTRNPAEMGLRSAVNSAAAPALCFYLLFLWFLVTRFL